MMGGEMMEGAGYGMFFGMIFWVLILVGIIALVIWVIQRSDAVNVAPQKESALDILKKRYARGEIDKEEFEEKRKLLS